VIPREVPVLKATNAVSGRSASSRSLRTPHGSVHRLIEIERVDDGEIVKVEG
jgi:hypothetical protein